MAKYKHTGSIHTFRKDKSDGGSGAVAFIVFIAVALVVIGAIAG